MDDVISSLCSVAKITNESKSEIERNLNVIKEGKERDNKEFRPSSDRISIAKTNP